MAFPRKMLNDNEDIVLDIRPHWMYFLEPIFVMVGLAVVAILIAWAFDGVSWLWSILGIAFVVWLLWTLYRLITWRSINFVITTDRVIYRSGVLSKSGIQIPLERINNVNFHQRVYERLFGAGDLLIESAGTSGQSRFSDINHPEHVQNVIYKAMEGNENKGWQNVASAAASVADAAIPGSGVSVAQELATLEGLRDRGSITPEEFDRQKAKLLGSLPPPPATGSPSSPPPPPPAP